MDKIRKEVMDKKTPEPILSDLCLRCAIKCTFKFEWAEEWDLEWNCECLVVHVQPIDPSHCVTSQEEFPYNVHWGSWRRKHCHHFITIHKRTLLSKSSNPLGIRWGSEQYTGNQVWYLWVIHPGTKGESKSHCECETGEAQSAMSALGRLEGLVLVVVW